ncbi:hypothetical protein QP794_07350 [Paenibacillus sp. UMB7766-LJ446]|uniref:hypothetical protein n=1 Tax=Paenibacillus sp. UMB7766-LJ446 TaxID=3046313 RepID=UPI00254B1C74|nr:hypothetical protein [Paenibacillus sp. UMB7766-LJ446]MDK8189899.1 hypothetical protein [Paenibacillus sp. UMB7766-LJ446]
MMVLYIPKVTGGMKHLSGALFRQLIDAILYCLCFSSSLTVTYANSSDENVVPDS